MPLICLLAALLHDSCTMLIVLLLTDPKLHVLLIIPLRLIVKGNVSYLMEAAQATKNASSDPACILALHRVTRGLQSNSGARVDLCKLLVESVIEANNQ